MKTIKIGLDDEIDSRLAEEIEKRIYFVSKNIVSFEVINDESRVKEINLNVEDNCDINDVKEYNLDYHSVGRVAILNLKNNKKEDETVA